MMQGPVWLKGQKGKKGAVQLEQWAEEESAKNYAS